MKQAIFLVALIAAAGPWSRPDIALLAGIAVALANFASYPKQSKAVSKWLIQACVVLLGLRLDLSMLAKSATDSLLITIGTIVGTLALGLLLGKLLRTGRDVSTLVSSGTAICGGSAIAAVGASIGASAPVMAVATGAIFLLNAVGLWTLPPIGHALDLTQTQFGTWAGIALHDVASVGGAAKAYGPVALDTANVVKLTRVIWIFPLALLAGRFMHTGTSTGARPPFPWFVLLFVAASAVRTFIPGLAQYESQIKTVSGVGFQVALFLIGTGLSLDALKRVGWRAIAQATILWLIVAAASLALVRATVE